MDQHQEAHRRAVEAQQHADREQQSRLQRLNDDWDRQSRAAGRTAGSGEASIADRAQLAIGSSSWSCSWSARCWPGPSWAAPPPAVRRRGLRRPGPDRVPAAEAPRPRRTAEGPPPRTAPTNPLQPRPRCRTTWASFAARPPQSYRRRSCRHRALSERRSGLHRPGGRRGSGLRTNPGGGRATRSGGTGALTVHRFSGANVAAPDLVGLSVDDARTVVTNLELTLVFDTPTETGTVQWQSKPPCTRLIRGTDVLVVGAG